ncbi:MAG: C39 family peptidase [Oscillospiraceae bacterium]|nr:C39 family peptidase [Oscillospiraceae bacterium]
MEEKEKKDDTPEKKKEPQESLHDKLERKRQARWRLSALLATLLMCSVLMLHLVVDKPSQAELDIYAYARENGISALQYPENLVALLERNPETEEFVLNYPFREEEPEIDLSTYDLKAGVPLFMQWDKRWGYLTCGDDMAAINGSGPMCLAMAGYYVTGDATFYPDRIVKFAERSGFCVEASGSKWTLISVGGPALGLQVKTLARERDKVTAYLQGGNPIIAVVGPGDFTDSEHFIVLTGYQNGMLTLNDPNSYVNSGKLWDFNDIKGQIRALWVIQAAAGE